MKVNAINSTYSHNKYQMNKQDVAFGNAFTKAASSAYDKLTDKLAIGMGKVIDSKPIQNFTDKFHNTNIATHIFSATGILLSSFFILSTAKSKKIEEERKKPLMVNTAFSCLIATAGGYTIDKLLDKPIQKFTDNFLKVNSKLPDLSRYKDGIRVAKSALIFGTLYKFVIPIISMCLAEKVVEKKKA